MSTVDDDLDQLLRDRFDLDRGDLVAALRTLPAQRPWAARLTESEARLLDATGFTEESVDYVQVAADVTADMARLYSTSYAAAAVAEGLQVSDSRVRQRRLAHTLWAINDGRSWVFPALQFEHTESNAAGRRVNKLKHVRGLDQVLPHLLTRGLHPTAIAGFIDLPQPELLIDGQTRSVREWLLHGESIEAVLELLEYADWTAS